MNVFLILARNNGPWTFDVKEPEVPKGDLGAPGGLNVSDANNFVDELYDAAKRKGDYDEETRKRDNAKQSLERYMHYFERWDAHQKARNKVGAA
eukprot:986642-Pelagomonas_calceolata.AAC.2